MERSDTVVAIVSPVVVTSVHMLIGGLLGIESFATGIALELRLPVSRIVHVLVH